MKAVIYRKTGPASEVLEIVEIDKPQPKPGEVLVRIRASGINPTDTKARAGIFPIQGEWPRILPHHDGAGVIEAVGEGVSQSRIGQRVWRAIVPTQASITQSSWHSRQPARSALVPRHGAFANRS